MEKIAWVRCSGSFTSPSLDFFPPKRERSDPKTPFDAFILPLFASGESLRGNDLLYESCHEAATSLLFRLLQSCSFYDHTKRGCCRRLLGFGSCV